ncbi:MAG: hypothetical protein AAFP04_04020 [Myxococcota bacterium]
MTPREYQLQLIREMTPAQRLERAKELYWSARAVKAAALRQLHPDWNPDRIDQEVRRVFLHART